MIETPKIEFRPEQPYVGISRTLTIAQIDELLPPLHDKLWAWLAEKGITTAGKPFFRYYDMKMDDAMEIEVGLPVHMLPNGEGEIQAGTLPAGEYATLFHWGHYDGLYDATTFILKWMEQNGWQLATVQTEQGERWASRLEIYFDVEETDSEQKKSMLAFLVAPLH